MREGVSLLLVKRGASKEFRDRAEVLRGIEAGVLRRDTVVTVFGDGEPRRERAGSLDFLSEEFEACLGPDPDAPPPAELPPTPAEAAPPETEPQAFDETLRLIVAKFPASPPDETPSDEVASEPEPAETASRTRPLTPEAGVPILAPGLAERLRRIGRRPGYAVAAVGGGVVLLWLIAALLDGPNVDTESAESQASWDAAATAEVAETPPVDLSGPRGPRTVRQTGEVLAGPEPYARFLRIAETGQVFDTLGVTPDGWVRVSLGPAGVGYVRQEIFLARPEATADAAAAAAATAAAATVRPPPPRPPRPKDGGASAPRDTRPVPDAPVLCILPDGSEASLAPAACRSRSGVILD